MYRIDDEHQGVVVIKREFIPLYSSRSNWFDSDNDPDGCWTCICDYGLSIPCYLPNKGDASDWMSDEMQEWIAVDNNIDPSHVESMSLGH